MMLTLKNQEDLVPSHKLGNALPFFTSEAPTVCFIPEEIQLALLSIYLEQPLQLLVPFLFKDGPSQYLTCV